METLLVIGAGPCGLAVGVAARQAGIDCLLIDRGPLVRSIERFPLAMKFNSTTELLEVGDVPFVIESDKPTRGAALAYYRAVARRYALRVRQHEEVVRAARREDGFELETLDQNGRSAMLRTRFLVVATGCYDRFNPLGVPGEDSWKLTHFFREPHSYYDQDVAVIGAGNSAVEAALAVWRVGARVSLIHFLEGFDRGVKPWVRPDIENRIAEGSIAVLWRHRVEAIEPKLIRVRNQDTDETLELPNDRVLAMTGYRPDHTLLEGLGVNIGSDGVPAFKLDTFETNVPDLFVAGVLVAGNAPGRVFIENGRLHGPAIVAGLETRVR